MPRHPGRQATEQGRPTSAAQTFGAGQRVAMWGGPVHCGKFGGGPGLHPLRDSNSPRQRGHSKSPQPWPAVPKAAGAGPLTAPEDATGEVRAPRRPPRQQPRARPAGVLGRSHRLTPALGGPREPPRRAPAPTHSAPRAARPPEGGAPSGVTPEPRARPAGRGPAAPAAHQPARGSRARPHGGPRP